MQTLLTFILFIGTLIFQTKLTMFGSHDLLIPLLIAYVVVNNAEKSLLYSFSIGFIQDSIIASGFINTFIKTVIALLATFSKHFIVLEDDKLCMLFAVVFTPISIIGSILATQSFQDSGPMSISWIGIIISTIINVLLAPMFLLVLNWINRDGQ